jgi:hypothetical protein
VTELAFVAYWVTFGVIAGAVVVWFDRVQP